ncbi:ABC transporter ATP-binding protein [Paenibacillus sp. 598K]|uniref:ABC transporter ATP-binding protein n=1 Tax=Paenibacillus sp. 598K TaxID=1117987 RepID=UPI000FFAFE8F|nr:ABC transporter ATP-binding protein [Paenibacillus sp. 598K]GBF74949.1 ABC transporter ATP-binding protein [Paenibacillus sp. 598K]
MLEYFYNITAGKPRSLLPAAAAALLDGIVKVIPAALLIDLIHTLYTAFADPTTGVNLGRMWLIAFLLFVFLGLQYVTYALLYDKTYRTAYEVAAEGRLRLADHVRQLSLGFIGKRDPGDLTNLLLSDYGQVEHTISHNVPQLISAITLPVLAFGGLLWLDWRMALAMLLSIPLGALLLWLSDALQRRLSAAHVQAKNEAASRLQEYLSGIREIKAHHVGGERFERLRMSFDRLKRASIRLEGVVGPAILGALLLTRSGMALMIGLGSYLLVGGSLSFSVFLLFLLVGTKLYEPLAVVMTSYGELRYSAYSAQRIMDVRREQPIQGAEGMPAGGEIVFEGVGFGYDPGLPVLRNLSFTIRPNTINALVGPSGSGKSTILQVLARFWDIQEGRILIGGRSVERIDPEQLLRHLSMVFQDVYLFRDTIGNNIRIGKPGASQEEVEQAARRACCHDFIAGLPQGYDTPVGEGGSTLSGGEKQRISIARALLKDASIVLLDEATAALDPENEAAVQQAIDALVADRTVILIAHRLRTVQAADQILVMDQGELVEHGSHGQLLAQRGLYAELWDIQQRAEDWSLQMQ